MRPLTPTSLYTPPPGCHPTRPWWRAGASLRANFGDASTGWTRSDGWEAYDNGYAYYTSAPVTAEEPEGQSYEEVLATVDAEWPLPPPPLRAGQVWLLEARQAVTTALLNTTLGTLFRYGFQLDADFYGIEAFAPSHARANRVRGDTSAPGGEEFSVWREGYLLGDQFLPTHIAESLLLGNDPMTKAYLIADPSDPSVVPWTGAKVGDW